MGSFENWPINWSSDRAFRQSWGQGSTIIDTFIALLAYIIVSADIFITLLAYITVDDRRATPNVTNRVQSCFSRRSRAAIFALIYDHYPYRVAPVSLNNIYSTVYGTIQGNTMTGMWKQAWSLYEFVSHKVDVRHECGTR